LKIPARSADRRSGCQPRAQHGVTAAFTHVLALQRTLGNRATSQLLGSRRLAGAVLQRTLRGMTDVVSGRDRPHGKGPLDEERGRQIMEEFVRNDQRSVADLDNVPEDVVANPNVPGGTPSLDQQEWGLIKEEATGEVHLTKGKKGSVEWAPTSRRAERRLPTRIPGAATSRSSYQRAPALASTIWCRHRRSNRPHLSHHRRLVASARRRRHRARLPLHRRLVASARRRRHRARLPLHRRVVASAGGSFV
jgi:hypothetical protein